MSTMWLSKYCLTLGIKEVECFQSIKDTHFFRVKGYGLFKIGRDIHKPRAEAVAAAEKMRAKKIASLRKQIARLEALDFGGGE